MDEEPEIIAYMKTVGTVNYFPFQLVKINGCDNDGSMADGQSSLLNEETTFVMKKYKIN